MPSLCRARSSNRVDYDDMLYLPLALDLPFPKFHLVLTDESQDFNAAQELILQKLIGEDFGRAIVVGDENQCVVKGTYIKTPEGLRPVENIKKGQMIIAGKGGNQFDVSEVTDVFARDVTHIPVVKIVTKSGRLITTTPEHTHFAGYDVGVKNPCESPYFVYLMFKDGFGYRIGLTQDFQQRLRQERADKLWILGVFKEEGEARYYEQYYSITYGIPTWVFYSENRDIHYTAFYIKRLFTEVDTGKNAERLAKELMLDLKRPHHIPKCKMKSRRNFSIILCADKRGRTALHSYAISGSDEADAEKLRSIGLNVRPAKRNKGWRVESSHQNLGEIYDILHKVQTVMEVNVIEKARLGEKSLPFCLAANVYPGMKMFVCSDEQQDGQMFLDEIIRVEGDWYTGKVYDLNIHGVHNYIANGILTHNSIYGFRGADSDAFKNILHMLESTKKGVEVCELPINYRSDVAILNHAKQWVPKIEGRGAELGQKEGEVREDTLYGQALQLANNDASTNESKPQFCFLCRITVPVVITAYQLIGMGKKVSIIGRKTIALPLLTIINEICGTVHKKSGTSRTGARSVSPTSRMSMGGRPMRGC